MLKYLAIFVILIVVLIIKIYFNYSKYAAARTTYVSPKILALDILKQKDESIRFFLDTVKDVKELNILVVKCIDQIKDECTHTIYFSIKI